MKAKKSVPKVSSAQRKKLLMSLQNAAAHQANGSSSRKSKDRYKIVVDTSVLISALFFGGNARRVLLHIATHHQLILSDYIVDEFIDFSKNTIPKTPQQMLRLMRQSLGEFVVSHESHAVEIRDVNDVEIMQLAIDHRAAIITSDKDILEHAMGATPPVLTIDEYEQLFID